MYNDIYNDNMCKKKINICNFYMVALCVLEDLGVAFIPCAGTAYSYMIVPKWDDGTWIYNHQKLLFEASMWARQCLLPPKLTWHLKITPLKRRFIFQTFTFRFHVSFGGCSIFLDEFLTSKSGDGFPPRLVVKKGPGIRIEFGANWKDRFLKMIKQNSGFTRFTQIFASTFSQAYFG